MPPAFPRCMGYTMDEQRRPVVGIANTYSRFNPCHRHFPDLVEAVFGLPCRVIDDPETGTPLVVPLARGRVPTR